MLEFLFCVTLALSVNGLAVPSNPVGDVKIVGGRPAEIEDYPYQVAIIQDSQLLCSGSIITPKDVLTAAHCVYFSVLPLTVHAGSTYWSKPDSVHEVVANVTHDFGLEADVAILKVDTPFVYDEKRQPIKLFAEGESAPTGAFAVLAGWGLTDDDGLSVLPGLSVVEVPLVDQDTCNRDYAGTVIGGVGPGQLCAGSAGKGPCRGDSGGALVYKGRQLGIVEMGKGCARAKYPGIYTDVAYYSKWIIENIAE